MDISFTISLLEDKLQSLRKELRVITEENLDMFWEKLVKAQIDVVEELLSQCNQHQADCIDEMERHQEDEAKASANWDADELPF